MSGIYIYTVQAVCISDMFLIVLALPQYVEVRVLTLTLRVFVDVHINIG